MHGHIFNPKVYPLFSPSQSQGVTRLLFPDSSYHYSSWLLFLGKTRVQHWAATTLLPPTLLLRFPRLLKSKISWEHKAINHLKIFPENSWSTELATARFYTLICLLSCCGMREEVIKIENLCVLGCQTATWFYRYPRQCTAVFTQN